MYQYPMKEGLIFSMVALPLIELESIQIELRSRSSFTTRRIISKKNKVIASRNFWKFRLSPLYSEEEARRTQDFLMAPRVVGVRVSVSDVFLVLADSQSSFVILLACVNLSSQTLFGPKCFQYVV